MSNALSRFVPVSTELVARNRNCVFLALLHGSGARKAGHGVLRRAVFEHMTQPLIVEKLRAIYEETFRECEAHRTTDIGVNCNVRVIVIHAAASLLDVDVLVHWEAEDGKLEWMLSLCSLQKRVLPWYNSMIRARGHCKGGVLSSAKNTISPILGALPGSFHFERVCSWLRYYFVHQFQNWCRNCCTILNLLSLVSFGDSKVSGSAFGLQPIKKCPGVRGSKSFGSELMGDIGLELRYASTSVTRVWNSSKVKTVVHMTLFKCFLAALTPASQSPPKWGALGGNKFYWVPSSAANWEIEFSFLDSVLRNSAPCYKAL